MIINIHALFFGFLNLQDIKEIWLHWRDSVHKKRGNATDTSAKVFELSIAVGLRHLLEEPKGLMS